MEENELFQQPEASVFDVTISPSVLYSFRQTSRWANIFAYIGGIVLVLMIVTMVFSYSVNERYTYAVFTIRNVFSLVVIVLAFGLYATLISLLFSFSIKTKKGLAERNLAKVQAGMYSLKFYFLISGLMTIVYVAFATFVMVQILMI